MVTTAARSSAGTSDGHQGVLSRYDWSTTGVWAGSFIVLTVGLVAAARLLGWDFALMARDPLAVARAGDAVERPYVGWVSHVGILLWAVAAVGGLAGARLRLARGERSEAVLLLTGALLSAGMLLDDLYMIHESLARVALGLPESAVVAMWAVGTVCWCVVFRSRLLHDRLLPLLLTAGGFFAASILVEPAPGVVAEEVTKLVGLLCWAAFHWHRAVESLARDHHSSLA